MSIAPHPELPREPSPPWEPPLVRGAPVVGSAIAFGRDAPTFLAACRRRHGDVFTVRVAGRRMTFVLDPHSHAGVLKLQGDLSFHELAHEISSRAFGHRRLRGEVATSMERVTASQLRGPALTLLTEDARRRLESWLAAERIDPDRPVELYDFVYRALFAAGAETLFGSGGWDAAARTDFVSLDGQFPLLAAGVPAALLGVTGARARLAARLRPGRPDASELARQRVATLGAGFSADEIGKIDLSVLWAALANTIPAAFWTLAHLVAEPAALAAVTDEVRGGAEGGLPRLQSAISEALRLTSASITLRRAERETTVPLHGGGSFHARAGDLVCLFPWLMHHDAEIFAEPERFRHDRFLPNDQGPPSFAKGGRRLATPLMPYGGGVSMCPGRQLANTEIKQLVVALLTRFDLAPVEGASLPTTDRRRAGLGVLPPTGGFRVRLGRVTP